MEIIIVSNSRDCFRPKWEHVCKVLNIVSRAPASTFIQFRKRSSLSRWIKRGQWVRGSYPLQVYISGPRTWQAELGWISAPSNPRKALGAGHKSLSMWLVMITSDAYWLLHKTILHARWCRVMVKSMASEIRPRGRTVELWSTSSTLPAFFFVHPCFLLEANLSSPILFEELDIIRQFRKPKLVKSWLDKQSCFLGSKTFERESLAGPFSLALSSGCWISKKCIQGTREWPCIYYWP